MSHRLAFLCVSAAILFVSFIVLRIQNNATEEDAATAELRRNFPNGYVQHHTSNGVSYFTSPEMKSSQPIVLALTGAAKLMESPEFGGIADTLKANDYEVVTLDLPCHGANQWFGVENDMDGWRERLDSGKDFTKFFNSDVKDVLDDLEHRGRIKDGNVSVYGISRGAFLAAHIAASDSRVQKLAMILPVTDLSKLSEFKGAKHSMSLLSIADQIKCEVLMLVAESDPRVGTAPAIAFAEESGATCVIIPGRFEHKVFDSDRKKVATWLLKGTVPVY